MRTSTAYLSILLLPTTISALRIPSIFAPFYIPTLADDEPALLSNDSLIPSELNDLRKRDGNCPADFNSCSTFAKADAGACCTSGSVCTTDHARQIACCPIGATCTGTIQIAPTTTTGAVLGGGGGGASTATTTTSGGSITAPTATGTDTVSYVSNAFFPFPYIPTTYANSALCNSAFVDCQNNYAACTAELGGGNAFGVTIVAPGGGVTVAPTIMSLGVASATSICGSLSSVGCYNIQSSNCAQFATGFVVGTGTTGAAAPRRTVGAMVTAGVMMGMGLGFAGQMV